MSISTHSDGSNTGRPSALAVLPDGIPTELRQLPRWLVWKFVPKKDGRGWTKEPYNARTGRLASSTNRGTWSDFDVALAAYRNGGYDGIGITLGKLDDDRHLVGVDLDDVRDPATGKLTAWATWAVRCLDSYVEVSPSATGVKALCFGELPRGRRDDSDRGVEMYDSGRYFALTGHRLDGAPDVVMERPEILYRLHAELLGEQRNGRQDRDDRALALEALAHLSTSRAEGYGDWLAVGMALHAVDSTAAMLGEWDRWSRSSDKYAEVVCAAKWATFSGNALGLGSLIYWAGRDSGWKPPRDGATQARNGQPSSPDGEPAGESEASSGGRKRPQVLINTEEFRVNDDVVAALPSAGELFQRGGKLVAVQRDAAVSKLRAVIRPAGSPRIMILPVATLREIAAREVRFVKQKQTAAGAELVPAHPPGWCILAVEARGEWAEVRHLEGVIEAPTLRPDGTVLDTPGWDEETGLLYEPNASYPPIPNTPSKTDAERAALELLDLVTDFPFYQDPEHGSIHQAAWLAACLTAVARSAVRGPCPLFLLDANCPGTGKSMLVDIAARIATGRDASRTTCPEGDEEMRKRITSIAIAGDRLMLLDNIDGPLGGAALDAALTATVWKDRVLGKSKMTAEMPLHCLWFATGNNVELRGDIPRRVVPCRLETGEEHPEERTGFRYPHLLEHVAAERPRLVVAGLTILRAFVAAGRPDQGLSAFGSYESWSEVIRAPVVWVLGLDPLATRERMRVNDVRRAALAGLVQGWGELPGATTGLTVAEALRYLNDPNKADEFAILRDALLCDSRTDQLSPSTIGLRLRAARGRVVDGHCIQGDVGHTKVIRWRVV
jgi:hypothetical protein